ncbi:unnamed protein product [Cyclocybe aegerita]|uniref:WD40 repeat-like protein n=1 Tax=Cyclocybe aegerita TaxID=1973307 RepID=A0A8S0W8N5_CYCAE|nr:unnamed protein product [Cyclocybe aegerita]
MPTESQPRMNFQIPLVFPRISGLHEREETDTNGSILEASLARAHPTVLECISWTTSKDATEERGQEIVLGCQDGSLYVLHCPPAPPPSAIEPSGEILDAPKLRSAKRLSKSSRNNSRSASPTAPSLALSPTFNVTAKPRVVSGINTEQVEAPKNYVDFDDEPDKLKGILKGKNPRERPNASDSGSEKAPKSTASSIIEPVPSSKRKNPVPRSLLSATNSRAPTPPSFSSPVSPKEVSFRTPLETPQEWQLRCHIVPLLSGYGRAVKSIQALHGSALFAVLQEAGNVSIFSSEDGACKASVHVDDGSVSTGFREQSRSRDIWTWCQLTVSYIEESTILVALASNNNDANILAAEHEDGASETSKCVLFEFKSTPLDVQLERLGQWEFDGPAIGDGIHIEDDGTLTFFSTSHHGHFVTREFKVNTPAQQSSISVKNDGSHHGPHLSTLPIPNPFKGMMSRSAEHLVGSPSDSHVSAPAESRVTLSDPHDVGVLIADTSLCGMTTHAAEDGKLTGIAWNHHSMTVFEYARHSLKTLFHYPAVGVQGATWLGETVFSLSFEERVELYQTKYVNANNEEVEINNHPDVVATHVQPQLIKTIETGPHDSMKCMPHSVIVSKASEHNYGQRILFYPLLEDKPLQSSRTLWQTSDSQADNSRITLTSMLPMELEVIIQGYSDGRLRQFSLSQMAREEPASAFTHSSNKTSASAINGYLVGLHVVQNPRTKEKYIVGGADDGSVVVWSLSTFEALARWTIFTTPLAKVLQFEEERTGPLRGCILCVAQDGTIAVIVVDGLHFLYLIPGSTARLDRICLGGHELLLVYDDHRARLWDAQTKELWRSMGQDKAEELLAQGGWSELSLNQHACLPKTLWNVVADSLDGQDAAATLSLKLERFLVDAIAVTKTISTNRDEVREILSTLSRLKLILSCLLTPGLSADVDGLCYGKLGAHHSSTLVGLTSFNTTTLYEASISPDLWCLSGDVTAARALAIIAVLRAMSLFEDLTEAANTVISFYSTSLGICIGPKFKAPSLQFLGRLWFESSQELRQSIRILIDATIINLTDADAIELTEKWQHYVPSLQPDAEKETINAALALLVCGSVAAGKYSLLSVNALMDISKSITFYLHDENSIYRTLAIDLCSRGFHVWQHYVDSMEILRNLFHLATSTRKESISIQNVAPQARLAVLSIATNNMPLLMGTICLDILTPPTMEHRRSVLQILAFLIRKRPQVLQPNLPRLMEAVVKSLDPNSTSNRELVLDTATEIIGFVVKNFPSVDFHMSSQRLAVGTNEGAVVMYDLKTAIRLYVLEGHKKPITASSFSPDGRRLVTVCLKESLVLVWKVGSSFASFFNPGAPPRQGHGGSEPFKTLNFNIGSDANMTTAETLELVRVEWIADRSVRVKIRQNVLAFST